MSSIPHPLLYLAPSAIAGVGVFAAEPVEIGVDLHLFADDDWAIVKDDEWSELILAQRYACKSTDVDDPDWYRPIELHRMSIGWYINHSNAPNVDTLTWTAVRPIEVGWELTIDYGTIGGAAALTETNDGE